MRERPMTQQTESAVERLAWSKGPCKSCKGLCGDRAGICPGCNGSGEVHLYLGMLLEECAWCINRRPDTCQRCNHTGHQVTGNVTDEKLRAVAEGLGFCCFNFEPEENGDFQLTGLILCTMNNMEFTHTAQGTGDTWGAALAAAILKVEAG